jgi:hypothetical protein
MASAHGVDDCYRHRIVLDSRDYECDCGGRALASPFLLPELPLCYEDGTIPFGKKGEKLFPVLLQHVVQKGSGRLLKSPRTTIVECLVCYFDACVAASDGHGTFQTLEMHARDVFTFF